MRDIILRSAVTLFVAMMAATTVNADQDVFVMPQERAQEIVSQLENWTLKSGERPRAVRIARDCMSANGHIMQAGYKSSNNFDPTVMAGMSFWSSVNGAAILRAERKGELQSYGQGGTSYSESFAGSEYEVAKRNNNIADFISKYYAECESIRKRFGG